MIPFNKPFLTGNEVKYIEEAVNSGKISGNGIFTNRCQDFFETRYNFKKCLLTTSCTDALEMAAMLFNIAPGDEVIVPSYTFVSTANAFILRGAKIVFADSRPEHPNIDADNLESLITSRTKAIVPVHYAGVACDMDKIMLLAKKYNLFVVEDAAQAIDSYYKEKTPLGGIGHLSAFSFHETKNVIAGEGGALMINDERLLKRAEVLWEKGTNRNAFFKGEVDKYGWIDIGSSFLPSEVVAAFLYAQLENLDLIQQRRKAVWNYYHEHLSDLQPKGISLPGMPSYATNNAHMFYLVCRTGAQRDQLINYLKQNGILAVFHYQSLHKSPYFTPLHDGRQLPNSDHFAECLVRLPFFYGLSREDQTYIVKTINKFFNQSV